MYDDDDNGAQLRAAAAMAVRTGRAALMVKVAIVIAVIGLVMLLILIIVGASAIQSQNDASDYQCVTPGDSGDAPPAATGTIEHQQITNAKTIAKAVSDLGLPGQATLVALTAAAGETDLINRGHGDSAGPDSRGLFQQRSAWGTEEQRMNPVYATQSFLLGPKHDGKNHGPGGTGLVAITGWQMLSASAAIHEVQRNADPNHYTSYQARAEQIAKKADIDLDAPGSPSAAASSDDDGGDAAATAAAGNDSGGECGTTGDDAIGPIGTGPCPLDSKSAPGKKNPSSCNQALTFVKKQMDSGSTAWGRQCLHLVMTAYGWHGGPATAFQAAQIVEAKHMMSKDTKHIPKGAVMWWDGRATGNTAGHVAIYDGNGHIFSNDVKGVGTVGVVPWTFPAKSWGQKWMGWSPPYFPTGV